jgi:hypothetical protein
MSDLYDEDLLLWSEQQAALLRRMGAGERVNNQVDWENVAEEIESVGRSQLSAVRSHIVQAFLHALKAEAWPMARDAPHWRAEALGHRSDAAEAYAPSMRQHLDMAKLYREALRRMPETNDGQPPVPVRSECPVTLESFLAEEP